MRLRKGKTQLDDTEILLVANVSDALAHPARIKLFKYIMQSNKSMTNVCNKDLVENFNYAQATISQHIKKLIDANLVEVKKENKYSYYYANMGMLMQYLDATKKLLI